MWASVFAAFKDEDGNGVIVGEAGSPTIFYDEAIDLIDELVSLTDSRQCTSVRDITSTGVYQHLNPSSTPPSTPPATNATAPAARRRI